MSLHDRMNDLPYKFLWHKNIKFLFSRMRTSIKGVSVLEGELTCLTETLSTLYPVLKQKKEMYPSVLIRYLSDQVGKILFCDLYVTELVIYVLRCGSYCLK